MPRNIPPANPPSVMEEMVADDDEEDSENGGRGSSEASEDDPLHPSATSSVPLPDDLREISPLASWTVSTHKPGCGVPALLSPSTASYWQSDGPQPHLLNIHFFKLVSIVKLRVYLDFELDESYTPTRMVFAAGMGEYGLVEFGEWKGEGPRGWVEVGLEGCGGGSQREEDEGEGGILRCMCLQIRVLENHQNGKDTHVRGVQIFARDDRVREERKTIDRIGKGERGVAKDEQRIEGIMGSKELDWIRESDLR